MNPNPDLLTQNPVDAFKLGVLEGRESERDDIIEWLHGYPTTTPAEATTINRVIAALDDGQHLLEEDL